MRCPYCGNDDTQVKDSRPTEDSGAIRRRRVCNGCGGRFTTFERVQLRDLTVVKKTGRKVPFDREKLARSVNTALRKRSVEPEKVERMISGIVRQLESLGDVEVTSDQIGEYVMEGLKVERNIVCWTLGVDTDTGRCSVIQRSQPPFNTTTFSWP